MSIGARGSGSPRLPRARGVLPHSRESCASSNRTSRFKSETASTGVRGGGSPRGAGLTNTGRRSGAGDGTRAPSRRRGKQKELTPHRARFAFDWGEYPGGDAGTGMYSKRTGACDWK